MKKTKREQNFYNTNQILQYFVDNLLIFKSDEPIIRYFSSVVPLRPFAPIVRFTVYTQLYHPSVRFKHLA